VTRLPSSRPGTLSKRDASLILPRMSKSTVKVSATPPPSNRTRWFQRALALTLPSTFFLAVGFRYFVSTGPDDTHITYWPAYTLARFGEILNYNGERVEQSSSLLHVLLLAAFHKLTGVDVITLGKLSSILAGVATLLLLCALTRKVADRATAFAAAMLAATSAYFVYWAFGGLETTLVSGAGAWLVLALGNYLSRSPASSRRRSLVLPALAMAAFALARPESPLVLLGLVTAANLLSWRRFSARETEARTLRNRLLAVLVAAAAVCALLFAFRLLYFGSAFPQPVTAKYVGLSLASFANGLQYLASSVFQHGLGIASGLVAAGLACLALAHFEWRARRFDPYTVLALLLVAGYLAFTVTSGGDWMEGGRFLVHVLPLALAFVPIAVAKSIRRERPRMLVVALSATVLVLLQAASLLSYARLESVGTLDWSDMEIAREHDVTSYTWFEKRNRVNMRDTPAIDFIDKLIPQIEAHRPGPVILMTGQMGMISYHVTKKHFRRVRFVDRRGLCDRALTGCGVLRTLSRDARGLHMEYLDYFARRDQIEETCAVPRPDVIFDLLGGNTQIVAERGYTLVARQWGQIDDTMGLGRQVQASNFVALRTDLWRMINPARSDSSGGAPPPRTRSR
jgi:hypothetical protein